MLTISNGWFYFSNTISDSRIFSIVQAAERSASTQQADNSLEMDGFEKIYDYVFCGSVKAEYMRYLHRMVHAQASFDIRLATRLPEERDGEEPFNPNYYEMEISESKRGLERMMSGTTIEFAQEIEKSAADKFLVFRNNASRKTIGLPLHSQGCSPQFPPTNDVITMVPKFRGIEDIRIDDLINIQTSGQLLLQEQYFSIRFIKNREPILMYAGSEPQYALLQRRLTHLWAVGLEKSRLTEMIDKHIFPDFSFANLVEFSESIIDRDKLPDGVARQSGPAVFSLMEDKLNLALSILRNDMASQARQIFSKLERFEKLINPTLSDQKHFLLLREKITGFNSILKRAVDSIKCNSDLFQDLFRHFQFPVDVDPLRIVCSRMLAFTDLRASHIRTGGVSDNFLDHPEIVTGEDSVYFSLICPTKLTDLLYAENFLQYTFRTESGATQDFHGRMGRLKKMLIDPKVPWSTIAPMIEEFYAKVKQVELGTRLSKDYRSMIESSLKLNKDSNRRVYTDTLDFLRKNCDELLNESNNFTDDELIDINTAYRTHGGSCLKVWIDEINSHSIGAELFLVSNKSDDSDDSELQSDGLENRVTTIAVMLKIPAPDYAEH